MESEEKFIFERRNVTKPFIMHFIPNRDYPDYGQFGKLTVADTVKQLSLIIADKGIAKRTFKLSKTMAKNASLRKINGWEDGDSTCPPIPPYPTFLPETEQLKTLWKEVASEQIEIANALTKLSKLMVSKSINKEMKEIASEIAGGVAVQNAK